VDREGQTDPEATTPVIVGESDLEGEGEGDVLYRLFRHPEVGRNIGVGPSVADAGENIGLSGREAGKPGEERAGRFVRRHFRCLSLGLRCQTFYRLECPETLAVDYREGQQNTEGDSAEGQGQRAGDVAEHG